MKPALAHHANDRFHRLQCLGIAAHHKDQFAFFSTPISTCYGSIEKTYASLFASRGNFLSQRWRYGARIDVGAARFQRRKGSSVLVSVGSPQHFFERRWVADHG